MYATLDDVPSFNWSSIYCLYANTNMAGSLQCQEMPESMIISSWGETEMHVQLPGRMLRFIAIISLVVLVSAVGSLAQGETGDAQTDVTAHEGQNTSSPTGESVEGLETEAKDHGKPDIVREREELLKQRPERAPVTARQMFSELPRFGSNIFARVRRELERRAEQEDEIETEKADRGSEKRTGERATQEKEDKETRWSPFAVWRTGPGSPLANVPVSPDYRLGPADTLQIQIWNLNKQRVDQTATMTAEGYITLPVLGKVVIDGMTVAEAKEHVRKRAAEFYSDPEIIMELVRPRALDVYVIGDVMEPGKYSLPGNATVFTALYAAGGPSETGSYRRIKLTRHGGEELRIDLYEYLMHGRRENDELLQAGDTVFVPPVEMEIAVAGAVRRPARYEILETVTVQQAVELASGFKANAYRTNVAVWQPDRADQWNLKRTDATTATGRECPVGDGMVIDVRPILDRAPTTITLIGPVHRPGVYDSTEGLTVSDLISRAQGPTEELYMQRGDIWRLNADYDYELVRFSVRKALDREEDPPVKPGDIVYLYPEGEVQPPNVVEVEGQIRKPGKYPFVKGMRVRDLILRAGDVLPGAYMSRAEVMRVTRDQRQEIIPVNLLEALAENDEHNVLLKPQDSLQVLAQEDMKDPSEVYIAGFVRNPGRYTRYEGMRVSDLIMAAGGLKPDAGATINYTHGRFEGESTTRQLSLEGPFDDFAVVPDPVLQDDDSIGVSGRADFTVTPKVVSIQGEVRQPGAYPLRETENESDTDDTLYDLIQRAGGLRDTANPRGMILYRFREEVIPADREDDLNQIFSMLNREKEEVVTGLTKGEQTEVIANSAAGKVSSEFGGLLGTESGALLVVPPRKIGISQLIRAIPIDGKSIIESEGKVGNLKLHHGDTLTVPEMVDFVTIIGSVSSPGAVQFVEGEKFHEYIDRAGGMLSDADRSRIILMRANGAVLPASKAKTVQPGDVIIVPSQHMFRTKHVGTHWTQSLRELLTLGAAALLF